MENEKKFFYANAAETAVSQFDFTIKFIRQGAAEGARAAVEKAMVTGATTVEMTPAVLDEFSVGMSPTHAKALAAGLVLAVSDYEKKVGPIALDKKFQDRYDLMTKTLRETK